MSCKVFDFIVPKLSDISHIICDDKESFYLKDYDFVVSKKFVPESEVCSLFCTTLENEICQGPTINDIPAKIMYQNCIKFITSKICTGTVPLSIMSSGYLYPLRPTKINCTV